MSALLLQQCSVCPLCAVVETGRIRLIHGVLLFPQNGNVDNPYCNGMEGILEAYHQSLKTVQLYGPTNFAPVVNHVARYFH